MDRFDLVKESFVKKEVPASVPAGKTSDYFGELVFDRKKMAKYLDAGSLQALLDCIERGKPVLCETPIALTAADAESLFSLAESLDVLLVEAVHTRFLPFFKQIVSVISSGAIGTPVMLTAGIASDMEELLGMSERIIVIHEGKFAGEVQKEDFNQETILKKASGL